MDLSDLISEESILPALKANSKKQAIQEIASHAAQVTGLPGREIFDTLLQRERLGSTGVGHGGNGDGSGIRPVGRAVRGSRP